MLKKVSVAKKTKIMRERNGKKGLLAAVGAWENYPRLNQFVADLYSAREKSKDRRTKRLH
jgi:hypothetical protein